MATSPVLFVYYPPLNDDSWPGVPGRHITEADWASFTIAQRRTVENATTQEGYTRRKVWVHIDLVDETEEERAQREAAEAAARAEFDRKNSLVRYGQIEAMIDQLEVLPPAEEFAALRADVDAVADVPPRVEAVETALTGKADAAAVTALEGTVSTVQVQTDVLAALRFDPASPAYGAVRGSVSPAQRTANRIALQTAADDARDSGGTLVIKGEYEIDGEIVIASHVDGTSGTLTVHDTALPNVLFVGYRVGTTRLLNKYINLPEVIQGGKTTTGWSGADTGVTIGNTYHCQITIPRVKNFSRNLWITAYDTGNVHNNYYLGWMENGKVNIELSRAAGTTGWVNQNQFYGGRCHHNGGEGVAVEGTRHLLLKKEGTSEPNGNIFIGTSLEAQTAEYHVEVMGSYNQFRGCRWETQGIPRAWFNGADALYNLIDNGYQAQKVEIINTGGAQGNKRRSGQYETLHVQAGTQGVIQIMNQSSSAQPAILVLPATAGVDPLTGWQVFQSANETRYKSSVNAFPRLLIAHTNGQISGGSGTTDPASNYFRPYGTVGWQFSKGVGMYGANPPSAQPAAIPDTSGAEVAALEAEINKLKAILRSFGLMAS